MVTPIEINTLRSKMLLETAKNLRAHIVNSGAIRLEKIEKDVKSNSEDIISNKETSDNKFKEVEKTHNSFVNETKANFESAESNLNDLKNSTDQNFTEFNNALELLNNKTENVICAAVANELSIAALGKYISGNSELPEINSELLGVCGLNNSLQIATSDQ